MTPNWQWWHSLNGERWHGPYDSREAAVADGRLYYDDGPDYEAGDKFYICEAYHEDYRSLVIDSDDLLDRLNDTYEDEIDPDADGLFGSISPDQYKDLNAELTAVLHAWIERHKIAVHLFWFADSRSEEEVPVRVGFG